MTPPAGTVSEHTPLRFLDPAVLARISTLELVARTVVEGFISGLHRSPYLGFSVDFAQYRQYIEGDDIRQIDWKVYARSDRHYVKQYEGETSTNVTLLLDISGSMAYRSGSVTKMEYARYLTASLAFFAQRQRDRVGLTTFSTGLVDQLPPRCRREHLSSLLHLIDKAKADAGTAFGKPLQAVAETLRRRGIVVLVSDLYAPTGEVLESIRQFRFQGNDVIVIQVLDPREQRFDFSDSVQMVDMESRRKLIMDPALARADYLAGLESHQQEIGNLCGALGVDFLVMETSRPLDLALYRYLSTRQKSR